MSTEFEFNFPTLKLKDIEDFERKYSLTLPYDYKEFMLNYNGGKTVLRRFQTQDKVVISSIMLFLPLTKENDKNLEEYYQEYNRTKIVPPNFLPIGVDPRANLICLSINGPDQGQVYFCDLAHLEEDKGLIPELIRQVASSFSEFVNVLFKPD